MRLLQLTILSTVYIIGFTLACFAQPKPLTVNDPNLFFDEYKSEVTLHRVDGTEVKANLIYNDGSRLFVKTEGAVKVQPIALSNVSKIVYADGSVEWIYGSFGDTYAATPAALVNAAAPAVQTTPNTEPDVHSGEVKLVFEPLDTRKSQFVDLMINGEYAATLHEDRGAVVTTEAGKHDIKMNLMGKANRSATTTLMSNGNRTYTIALPGKVRFRNIRDKNTDIDEVKGLNPQSGAEYAEVTLGQTNYTWDSSFFPFTYATLNYNATSEITEFVPENSTASVGFSMGSSVDFPISKNQGIYMGIMYNLTYLTFTTTDGAFGMDFNESIASTLGPSLTYFFMNQKTLTPFAGIEVPITANSVITDTYSSTSSPETEMLVGVNLRAGAYVFLGRSMGLVSQVRAGTTGGVSFQAGLSFRILNKKNAHHRGAYWYGN